MDNKTASALLQTVNTPYLWDALVSYTNERIANVHREFIDAATPNDLLVLQGRAQELKELLKLRDKVRRIAKEVTEKK